MKQVACRKTRMGGLVETVTNAVGQVHNVWSGDRDVLEEKGFTTSGFPGDLVSWYGYTVNALGQRTSVETDGEAFGSVDRGWGWGYNARGEVVSGTHADDAAHDRGYAFDGIGNRTSSTDGSGGGAVTTGYTADALNRYSAISNGGTVNPVHDDDGNLLEDQGVNLRGVALEYVWDGENRLVEVRRASDDALVASYAYDFMSRRVRKTTTAAAPQGAGDTAYVYDEWNPLAEYDLTGSLTAAPVKRYVWGDDLSGSAQGAGGVGGLLVVFHGTDAYYPVYDGNGNVVQYLDDAGDIAAGYEYDPFGRLVATSGDWDDFAHRFSTKPQDEETGMLYYGHRYYEPLTGRWPSRDPIGERGGLNLHGFVGNDGVNAYDYLGREDAQKKVAQFKLTWKTLDLEMGKCGHFKWTIEWSVNGGKAKGLIFQEVVKVADIKNCDTPPGGRGPQQLGGLVYEAWDWPSRAGGAKDTWSMQDAVSALGQKCQGEYAVQGKAYFTKSKLKTKPVERPQLPDGSNFGDLGMPLLDGGFSMSDYQVVPDVDPVNGNQVINASEDSGSMVRMIQVKWNCCNGENDTEIVKRTPDPK